MDTTGAFLVFRIERVESEEHTAQGYEVLMDIAPWMSLIHRDTSDQFALRALELLREACRHAPCPRGEPAGALTRGRQREAPAVATHALFSRARSPGNSDDDR